MVRELSERDIEILKKMAPEVQELLSAGASLEFHNILPPISRHFARDEKDFAERLCQLTPDDLEYLAAAIEDGSESLGCMPLEDVEVLVQILQERVSPAAAQKVQEVFETGGGCE